MSRTNDLPELQIDAKTQNLSQWSMYHYLHYSLMLYTIFASHIVTFLQDQTVSEVTKKIILTALPP